jgi:hypothetical protein
MTKATKRPSYSHWAFIAALGMTWALLFFLAAPAYAQTAVDAPPAAPAPEKKESAEEAFRRSLSQNIEDAPGDPKKVLAVVAAVVAVLVGVVAVSQMRAARRPRGLQPPRGLNHPGKLINEVGKGLNLKKSELKQLKQLCQQQDVKNPLALLLCPSSLAKAVQESPKKLDRAALAGIAKKLRT